MTFQSIKESGGTFSVPTDQLLARRVTSDGTPGGPASITGDYSVTPQDFYVEVPPGEVWYVRVTEVFAQGVAAVRTETYGPSPALTNGVNLVFTDAAHVPMPSPLPLLAKTTADYEMVPGVEINILDLGAGGLRSMSVHLSPVETFGSYIVIREGQRFSVTAQDDMTGLTEHVISISGYILTDSSQ